MIVERSHNVQLGLIKFQRSRGCNYGPLRLGSGEIDPEETVASVYSRFQTALKEPKVRSTWDVSMSKFVWRTKKVLNSNMKVRNLYLKK